MSADTIQNESSDIPLQTRAGRSMRANTVALEVDGPLVASPDGPQVPARPRHSKQNDSVRRVSRAAIAMALDMTPDAVFFLSPTLQIVDVNAVVVDSTGYCRRELQDVSICDVIGDDGNGAWREAVARVLRGRVLAVNVSARQVTKHGDWFPVSVQVRRIECEAELLFVAVVRCANNANDQDVALESGGDRDYLTSLPTRAALARRLRAAERRAKRRRRPFSVLFIDLDHFKRVNDAQGHAVGDEVLRIVGERLRACVRPTDFVARYGGDEFVAVIENVCDEAEVQAIAGRISAELSRPILLSGRRSEISASVGVAIGKPSASASALLSEADRAMYAAKRRRRATSGPSGGRSRKPHVEPRGTVRLDCEATRTTVDEVSTV